MADPTPRWTAETETAATCALWEFGHLGSPLDEATERDEPAAVAFTRGAVRAVLDSLARAGVLLTVGGETRQEVGATAIIADGRTTRPVIWGQTVLDHDVRPTHTRTITTWPDGSTLTGPWREVTDDPA